MDPNNITPPSGTTPDPTTINNENTPNQQTNQPNSPAPAVPTPEPMLPSTPITNEAISSFSPPSVTDNAAAAPINTTESLLDKTVPSEPSVSPLSYSALTDSSTPTPQDTTALLQSPPSSETLTPSAVPLAAPSVVPTVENATLNNVPSSSSLTNELPSEGVTTSSSISAESPSVISPTPNFTPQTVTPDNVPPSIEPSPVITPAPISTTEVSTPTTPQVTGPTVTYAPAQAVVSHDNHPVVGIISNVQPNRNPFKNKLFLIGGLLFILLLVLPSAYVFGFYIPNQPDNVYKTGLSRTGKALDAIVKEASKKSNRDAFKKSEISLNADASSSNIHYTGALNTKFDNSKVDGNFDFVMKAKGQPDKKINVKLLSQLPDGTIYPDTYVQVNGLKTLNFDAILPQLLNYDGKWIAISSDYLKSLSPPESAHQTDMKKHITADDLSELAKAATQATDEYVLTSNTNKSVFIKKGFIGKEKIDGLQTYHYEVTINKDHADDYCKALIEKIYSTNAYKKLPFVEEKNVNSDKKNAQKDCDRSSSSMKTDTTYDLWVEAKYKLIYKLRIPDDTAKDAYKEIGQIYKGGDNVSFFANIHDEKLKSDAKLTFETNFKTAVTKGSFFYSSTDKNTQKTVKVTLDAKPYKGEITIVKPANAIPLKDILHALDIDPTGAFSTGNNASTHSQDELQKANILTVDSQLEGYYAQNGLYPTFAQLNDSVWRKTNLRGFDDSTLQDYSGKIVPFVTTPTPGRIAYQPINVKQKICDNKTVLCDKFVLTVILTNGPYTKSSLN
ncbi:MAG: hypothetical protein NVS3B23_08900 [Candidatus Saccharimonadales bacterium]